MTRDKREPSEEVRAQVVTVAKTHVVLTGEPEVMAERRPTQSAVVDPVLQAFAAKTSVGIGPLAQALHLQKTLVLQRERPGHVTAKAEVVSDRALPVQLMAANTIVFANSVTLSPETRRPHEQDVIEKPAGVRHFALPKLPRQAGAVAAVVGTLAACVATWIMTEPPARPSAPMQTQTVTAPATRALAPTAPLTAAAPRESAQPTQKQAPMIVVTDPVARPLASTRAAETRQARAQTPERTAVDALFAGDYAQAEHHYAALARDRPNQAAFAEIARMLRQTNSQ